jgi:hypothetical protein
MRGRCRLACCVGGWIYRGAFDREAIVVWRYANVWAGIGGQPRQSCATLELARKRQRRIAAAPQLVSVGG